MVSILIGIVVFLIGCSFAYKFVRACVFGKFDYWAGFLPISIFSPLFVHAPPPKGKRTLVRETSGLWVHLFIGPLFLVLSILAITAGCDLMGLSGTDTLNYILTGGNRMAPLAVTYDKRFTFQFPFLVRTAKRLGRIMGGAQIPLPADKRIIDSPAIRAAETARQRESERKE